MSLSERVFGVTNPREVWLISGAHGVNEFYSVAIPPILPLVVADFGISYGEAGVLLTVFFVTYSMFQLPAGMLADRVGQRWLLAVGMVVLAIGVVAAAVAQRYETLLFAQALGGIGGSTYHPSGMSLISDLEQGPTEGKAMGIHGLGGVVGTALAPALIGGVAVLADWRTALAVAAVVGIVYAVGFLALFRDIDFGDTPSRTDGGSRQPGSWWTQLADRITVPLERWVAVLFITNLAIATQIGAVRTFTTSYLVDAAGLSTTVANGIFFITLIGAGVSSLGGGLLADSVDRSRLGIALMVGAGVVFLATGFVPQHPVILVGWFFVLGMIVWAAVPTMNALTSSYSERSFSGSLFGVMLTAGSIGSAGGPLLFGIAAEQIGIRPAFAVIAGVSAVGALAFLAVSRL
ncbi:MAG: MFS transporter [Salinirussus sp.]